MKPKDAGAPREKPANAPASPIADLSYRNYDGPLHTRAARWWVVTMGGLRHLPLKPLFWICVILAMMPYLIFAFMLYLRALTHGANPMMGAGAGMLGLAPEKYAVSFYQALNNQCFFLFLLSLLVGSGAIAADNRANALQVYLSKPITKGDYVLGKWMSIFLRVYAVALAPALMLYVFCLLSFSNDGFWAQDHWLILRVIVATAIPAALYASLLLGFSAWSKTPFMAAAFYAALYFISGVIALTVAHYGIKFHGAMSHGVLIRSLSLEGIITGLAQNVYAVDLQRLVARRSEGMMPEVMVIHPPPLWPVLAAAVGLAALGLAAARMRVRAVEVVRG